MRAGLVFFIFVLTNASNAIFGQGLVTNTYTISDDDFANPERGFYIQADSYASAPSPVPSNLASIRVNGNNSPGNTYTAKISLLLRLFYLDTFVNSPISSSFLDSIQTDFDSIRAQGSKAIVRFAYNQDQTRPFAEPTKALILSHIQQLAPLLKKNGDVIAVVQEGFIGAWGEGYFTDIFYTNGQAKAQNWLDRADVLAGLLSAAPVERMIQVRTPQIKQKYVYGPTAPTGSAPISSAEAFSGSGASRIGFHNDCYLADSTDEGTFSDYDFGVGTSQQDITNLRNYLAQDTRYVPMGGETCAVNPPTDECALAGGNADTDMARSHYSFLNEGYNAAVNDNWVQGGCIEYIKRRLGYRLELISGIYRTEAQPGQAIPLTLTFENIGFAAPFNPRGLELILRNAGTGQKFFAALSRDTDVRRWLPGTNYTVNTQLSLPRDVPTGDYELLLNLPDPAPSLYGGIPYSIRLANSNAVSSANVVLGGVWEASTGYHDLHQTLTINGTATNPPPSGGEIPVLAFSAIPETYATWSARNFPPNSPAGSPDADPDGDGRANLLEYALGTNPNSPDSGSEFNISFQNTALLLSFPKGPGCSDVNYEIESSPDLTPGSWTTSSVTIVENDAANFRASYTGMTASGFLRLKISLK